MVREYSVILSFLGGIASFFSPCILPLIPVYISYLTGYSIDQFKESEKISNLKIFLVSIFFILGFTFVFTLMGASATFLGKFIISKKKLLRYIGGTFIILFGLHLLGILKIKKLYSEKKLKIKKLLPGYFYAFLVGVGFSAGWTPCVGPILSSILIIASNQETVLKGIILLFFYSLGIGIPLIIISLLLKKFYIIFSGFKKHYRKFEIFTGFLLILLGFLLIFNKLF